LHYMSYLKFKNVQIYNPIRYLNFNTLNFELHYFLHTIYQLLKLQTSELNNT